MSYFISGTEAQEIDWMTVDLVDACSDPMFENMGLDGNSSDTNESKEPVFSCPQSEAEDVALQPKPSRNNSALFGTAQSSTKALHQTPDDMNESNNKCCTCGLKFGGYWPLSNHVRIAHHPALRCNVSGCDQTFSDFRERDAHQKRTHVSGHGRVATPNLNECVECKMICTSKADLLRHAKVLQHQPYGCECGARFSRLDVLNRHLDSYSTSEPEYPCKYCKRHRGVNGFRRQDHLMQHIRNYHHHETEMSEDNAESSSRLKYVFPTCPHPDCPQYRGDDYQRLSRVAQLQSKPFASQSAFTKHMREEHNESTFPCGVVGCGRVGRRGYFREKDLIKHRKEQHPDAAAYKVTNRDTRFQCLETGCGRWLDPSSLGYHYALTHGQSP